MGDEPPTPTLNPTPTPHQDGSAFQTTALHWAAQGGHVAAVRKLLEAGASVNCTNAYRQTALQCCVFEGHLRTAELVRVRVKPRVRVRRT